MKRFKNLFFVISLVAALIGAFGCQKRSSNLQNWMEGNGKIKILSTTSQIGDLVTAIGGDRIDHLVLIQGDLDPHSYELVKGDGEKIERAEIIFYNGLGLEHGASLSTLLQKNERAVPVGEWIANNYPDQILNREGTVDPHIWMDISLWKKGIEPIKNQLISMDRDSATYFEERAAILNGELERVDLEIKEMLSTIPNEKRYLVTSHDAFQYFTRSYLADPKDSDWKIRFAAPEGLAPDGQLNPIDLKEILDYLLLHRVNVLFPESNVNQDSIRKIAVAGKELGLEIQVCSDPLYGDSTSGHTYLDSMRQNAVVLSNHLR